MERKRKSIVMAISVFSVFIAQGMLLPIFSFAGDLEPTHPPGSTMKTLDEIPPTWSQILPADDGGLDGCGSSRFECVMGGEAVLDKETGLTWARTPNPCGLTSWQGAHSCLTSIGYGLRFGWRLPAVYEIQSLFDVSMPANTGIPRLSLGHPFLNVPYHGFWTSSEVINNTNEVTGAYSVHTGTGHANAYSKTTTFYVWAVRGGGK